MGSISEEFKRRQEAERVRRVLDEERQEKASRRSIGRYGRIAVGLTLATIVGVTSSFLLAKASDGDLMFSVPESVTPDTTSDVMDSQSDTEASSDQLDEEPGRSLSDGLTEEGGAIPDADAILEQEAPQSVAMTSDGLSSSEETDEQEPDGNLETPVTPEDIPAESNEQEIGDSPEVTVSEASSNEIAVDSLIGVTTEEPNGEAEVMAQSTALKVPSAKIAIQHNIRFPYPADVVKSTVGVTFSNVDATGRTCMAYVPSAGVATIKSVEAPKESFYYGAEIRVFHASGQASALLNGKVDLSRYKRINKIEFHMRKSQRIPKTGTSNTVVITSVAGSQGTNAGCRIELATWMDGSPTSDIIKKSLGNEVRILNFTGVKFSANEKYGFSKKGTSVTYRGKVAHMSGVNFYDPISYSMATGAYQRDYVADVFNKMKQSGMSYCRVSFSPYWPNDYKAYEKAKGRYYSYMDEFVRDAERVGIGVIPVLFWNTIGTSDYLHEHYNSWGNASSKTRKFMQSYVKDVVTRFRRSPAIWGWEFSNEMNLYCDLPNAAEAMQSTIHPELGTPSSRTKQDHMTTTVMSKAISAFYAEVRKYDTSRLLLPGNAAPRERAYDMYLSNGKSWGSLDTEADLKKILALQNPGDVITVHLYRDEARGTSEMSKMDSFIGVLKRCADSLGKVLVIEEFGGNVSEFGVQGVRSNINRTTGAIIRNDIGLSLVWGAFAEPNREPQGDILRNSQLSGALEQISAYNWAMLTECGEIPWKGATTNRIWLPAVSAPRQQIVAKGAQSKPKVAISGLREGTDYVISYYNNKSAGTATMIVNGRGRYIGARRMRYSVRYAIPSFTIPASMAYTGKPIRPTVKIAGLTSKDYKVSYKNVTKVGKGTVIVTGSGSYGGSVTKTFAIFYPNSHVSYDVHMQGTGWKTNSRDGAIAGRPGKAKRVEALRIRMTDAPGGSVIYRSYVQGKGWMPWCSDGKVSGTIGQSKRVEAVCIKLGGVASEQYDISYSAYVQGKGWTPWAKNGQAVGKAGKRIEGIKVKLVRRSAT